MRIAELNWMDVEKYLEKDDRIILILGACEQHGYLSLQTDTRIPLALADVAAKKTGVLIAPEVNIGVSPYFLTYPGTISLRTETLLAIVEDMVRSLYGVGFRKMLVLNGHMGNQSASNKLVELANQLPGLQTAFYSWWMSHSVEEIGRKHGLLLEHANWMEAFPFNRVAELPDGEKVPVHVIGLLNAEETRIKYGDGVFGGNYYAKPNVMDELFNACVMDVLDLLDRSWRP